MVTKDLARELDDGGVPLIEGCCAFAMLDDVDDRRLDAFLQRFRLVCAPLELAVHFTRGRKDRNLAHAR